MDKAESDKLETSKQTKGDCVTFGDYENTATAGEESALDDHELAEYLAQDQDSKVEVSQPQNNEVKKASKSNEITAQNVTDDCSVPNQESSSIYDKYEEKVMIEEPKEMAKDEKAATSVSEKQQYNMDESTEDESSNASKSRSSSADSTPIKHLEPPTPTPASQKTKKAPKTGDGARRSGRSGRFPNRQGIVWRVGAKIEAKDFQQKWYTAKILEVDGSDNTVMVHFEGWNSRYDDWFPMTSDRLRCITRHSERKETRSKATHKAEHKVGDCVFAKWTDCRMYPGKIVRVGANSTYEVLFYDGFKKNVVAINVKTMPDEVQQEYAKAGLLPEVGKKNRFPIKDLAKEIQDRHEYKVKSPESSSRRHRTDSERKSVDRERRDKHKVEKEEWEVKSISPGASVTEKRKRSTDAWQPLMKKQREESKPERRDSRRESAGKEEKVKREVGRPRKSENRSSPQDKLNPSDTTPENTPPNTKPKPGPSKKTPPVLPPISVDVDTEVDAETSTGCKSEKTTPKSTPKTPLTSPMDTLTTEPPSEEYHCPYSACKKTFRKKSLVDYHVKYYHTEDGSPVQPPPPRGKRRKTTSVCSDDSELSFGGQKSRGRKKQRASLESTVSGLPEVCNNEDAMSEDTKTTTTEEYSQSLPNNDCEDPLLEEEEDTGVDRIEKDEVVNCICQINEENGLMIQCDVCLCWQHALCMEITEETLPAKYVCYVCMNPPGVRESGRFIYDQDWIKMGTMQRFSFSPEDRHTVKKARIMEATHSLVGDMISLKQVLDSTKRELSVLGDDKNPELQIWQKQLDPDAAAKQAANKTDIDNDKDFKQTVKESVKTNCNSVENENCTNNLQQSTSGEEKTSSEHSPEDKCENDKVKQNICENGVSSPKEQNDVKEEDVPAEGQSPVKTENGDINPEPVKVEVKEEKPFENCSINLLEHVTAVHDNVEERLDLLEEQIAALESAEDGKNVDILKDVPKVKKSIHQLINDLSKVKRMSMYH